MYRREAEIQPHTHALCKALKRAQRRVCIPALQLAYVALGYSGALRELLLSKAVSIYAPISACLMAYSGASASYSGLSSDLVVLFRKTIKAIAHLLFLPAEIFLRDTAEPPLFLMEACAGSFDKLFVSITF